MKNQLKNHLIAYIFLITGLVIGAVAYIHVWPNQTLMRLVALLLPGFYFIWGVATHVKTKRISVKVVYEYAAIALLASVTLLLLTF